MIDSEVRKREQPFYGLLAFFYLSQAGALSFSLSLCNLVLQLYEICVCI